MAPFEDPHCNRGHPRTPMTFLESHDPIDAPSCGPDDGCTEWRERWRYACPECGRVIEILESVAGTYERVTIRASTDALADDPTTLRPVE